MDGVTDPDARTREEAPAVLRVTGMGSSARGEGSNGFCVIGGERLKRVPDTAKAVVCPGDGQ